MVSRDVARDLEHAALFLQGELLAKQGDARAQVGMRERLRSFARQLEDSESLPEAAMRAVVREVRGDMAGLSPFGELRGGNCAEARELGHPILF